MTDLNQPQEIFIGSGRKPRVKQPRTFAQLGILVLDGSGSMEEQTAQHISKADAVSMAVRDLFSRFKASSISRNFDFAIINYDHHSIVKMHPTPVKDIDDQGDYNPMEGLGGATYISEGLKDAKEIAEQYLSQEIEGGLPYSVVVVVMTDGVDMSKQTKDVADKLKQIGGKDKEGNPKVKVCGCFFETLGADAKKMHECNEYVKSLCTSPMDYSSISTDEELRKFFIASMSNQAAI